MNYSEWIRKESNQWVADGIITSEQCDNIINRYPVSKATNSNRMLFAVIGSLLIGAGIILIFATNWWELPITAKIALAFLPLLSAQAVCIYTAIKKRQSAAFTESSAVFLSLSFFAAVALIGQTFHTPAKLDSYFMVGVLFILPCIYFFRAKAAAAIYASGAIYVSWFWPTWVSLVLTAIILPFFFFEIRGSTHKGKLNYLLLLLSCLVSNTFMVYAFNYGATIFETALVCGLVMLVLDAVFCTFSITYFFTSAKFFAFFFITMAMLATTFSFYYMGCSTLGFILMVLLSIIYAVLRRTSFRGLASTDILAAASIALLLVVEFVRVAAILLVMVVGAIFIVRGSQKLKLNNLNYGMGLVLASSSNLFFNSSMNLFARGILFILLGFAFLGMNLLISHKRKELRK